eukprot:1132910-Rhodomonas_salina.1
MRAYSDNVVEHVLALYSDTGRLCFILGYTGGNMEIQGANPVQLNTWMYVTVVFFGPVISMYFDGTLIGLSLIHISEPTRPRLI